MKSMSGPASKVVKKEVDILVVDDRLDGLIALEVVLTCKRVNVVRAQSGMEALRLIPHYDFAVILLDVQMPEMDGFETAAKIKESASSRDVPILFVTAINNDDRYIYKGYETGAVDYVFKPFDPLILRSKVSVFVDLFLQARRIREQEARLLEAERNERVRQLAELELEALRRYQSLADAVPHIICRTRADGTPDYFNKGWTDYTGMTLEASVNEGWHQAFHPEDLDPVLRSWVNALIFGRSFDAECRFRRKDGMYRWHLIRAVPERRSSGEVIAWIASSIDIDDRKRTEGEMIRAKEEAESASSAKTQFLANVSHEIRTPLSAIIGFSELLLNPSQNPDERLQAASTIHRNGQQLLHLINEILDISKVESGRSEIEHLEINLLQMLRELQSLFELKANEKSLRFEIFVEGALPVPALFKTDPTRLRQIIVNMIANAVKFTDSGSVTLSVRAVDLNQICFAVEDTGIGIPESSRARLFQPFSQVDSSTSRKFGGTGLGLALSKRFAESLGGDVNLMSSGATGSRFEAHIQIEPSGASPRAHLSLGPISNLRGPVSVPQVPESGVLNGFNLLLVDDAIDNQVLISRFLRLAGAKVETAGSGSEAIEKATRAERMPGREFDVILMDIQMPGMDGYAATQHLRSSGWKKPILALTAHALKAERDRCLAAGFDDHFTKPVDRMKLISGLVNWLGLTHSDHKSPSEASV